MLKIALPQTMVLNVAIALVAMATMMQQVLFTRLFSVTLYYHYSFLVISFTMLGLTGGALIVHYGKQWINARGDILIAGSAALLACCATVVALLIMLNSVALTQQDTYAVIKNALLLLPCFTFSGITIAILLLRNQNLTSTRYAFDLCGAAIGCLLALFFLESMGVINSLLSTALIYTFAGIGCSLLALKLRKIALFVLLTLSAIMLVNSGILTAIHPLIRLHYIRGANDAPNIYESWNSYSRVVVSEGGRFHWISIDNKAATVMESFPGNQITPQNINKNARNIDISNVAYHLRPVHSTLVIGVGGGRDILSAIAFDIPSITGLEMNRAIYRLLTKRYVDLSGHISTHKGVSLINAEARSFLEANQDHFGLIQISLIDTWAATAAGAFSLSENGLYTVEAWRAFIRRLNPDGMLTVARWFNPRTHPGELYRMLSLARQTLKDEGIEAPENHIAAVYNRRDVATLIVSRAPITREEISGLTATMKTFNLDVILSPFDAHPSPLTHIVQGANVDELQRAYHIDLSPSTDNRPFFFNMITFRGALDNLFSGNSSYYNNINGFNVLAVMSVFYAFISLMVVFFLVLASKIILKDRLSANNPCWDEIMYFILIGFGFMLIEIGVLQRLALFLGHPTYALSIVLFVLLLASGLGSLTTQSTRFYLNAKHRIIFLCAVLGGVIVLSNPLMAATRHMGDGYRIAVAIILLLPSGFVMGMAFPIGMQMLTVRGKGELAPWFWGMNGVASVVASVLAMLIAIFAGINTSLWAGEACYMALAVLFAKRFQPAVKQLS